MLQVREYVYPRTNVRASSYTFGVFCVWISWCMLKCAFKHSFLAILIRENLSYCCNDKGLFKYDYIKDGRTCNRTVFSEGSSDGHSGSKTQPYCRISENEPQVICVTVPDITQCRMHLTQIKTLSKRHQNPKMIKKN